MLVVGVGVGVLVVVQKIAYVMLRSVVGSGICVRGRSVVVVGVISSSSSSSSRSSRSSVCYRNLTLPTKRSM